MPPNVGAMFFTVLMNSSTFLVSISISNTSISAKILNSNPLPSITGFDASGPMSPKPKTAVPLEITATRFPLAVYLYTFFTFFSISRQGSATPGEYANDKSLWVAYFFVGTTLILPGVGFAWYISASLRLLCLLMSLLVKDFYFKCPIRYITLRAWLFHDKYNNPIKET